MDLLLGHQNGASGGVKLVGNLQLVQLLDHLVGIGEGQVGKEDAVIGLLGPEHHGKADGHTGREPHHQPQLAQDTQAVEPGHPVAFCSQLSRRIVHAASRNGFYRDQIDMLMISS